jgi:hypothetical protein
VLDEAEFAKAQGALVQARWMDVNPPLGFRQYQAVDIIGWRRGVPALTNLIATLERVIGQPDNPTRGSMGIGRPSEPPNDDTAAHQLATLRDAISTWDQFVFRAYLEQRVRLENSGRRLSMDAMVGPKHGGSLLRRLLAQFWKTTKGERTAIVRLSLPNSNKVLRLYQVFLNEAVPKVVQADFPEECSAIPRYEVLGTE